ncbi:unnamed protein product [Closterium sp. Naga37s-1]|nr:unnamed protein product [Closterium sp. Naga37s-1]
MGFINLSLPLCIDSYPTHSACSPPPHGQVQRAEGERRERDLPVGAPPMAGLPPGPAICAPAPLPLPLCTELHSLFRPSTPRFNGQRVSGVKETYPWALHQCLDSLLDLPAVRQRHFLSFRQATSPVTNALGSLVFLGTPFYIKKWQRHGFARMLLSVGAGVLLTYLFILAYTALWELLVLLMAGRPQEPSPHPPSQLPHRHCHHAAGAQRAIMLLVLLKLWNVSKGPPLRPTLLLCPLLPPLTRRFYAESGPHLILLLNFLIATGIMLLVLVKQIMDVSVTRCECTKMWV